MTALRQIAAALVLSTAVTATVSACGGDEPAADDTLTVMAPLFGTAPNPDGEMQQAVEKLIGKKLSITWVPNADYNDKTNVTLASNNIPQVMVIQGDKQPSFVRTAQAGAFWDLTGKLDKYPNLKPANEQTGRNASVNGKIYGIYRVRPLLRSAVLLRKDWLAKVGLPMPESVDDLYRIAKAFTEQDPDGDGKKNTYGLIIPKWPGFYASSSPYDVFETWYGAPNGWGERGGKLVPGFDTEEFYTADRALQKWVDEGLVNPDFATLDSGNWNDPFVAGKGGIIIDVNVRATALTKLFRQKDPKDFDKVAMTGNLKSTLGRHADIVLDSGVEKEACPLNLAPTASTTATLALGDALALALLDARGFASEDFAMHHPGGSLGRRLLVHVRDIMRKGAQLPRSRADDLLLPTVLDEMSRKGIGMTAVVDEGDRLVGIFTDGDLRRYLERNDGIKGVRVGDVMTRNPVTIQPDRLAAEAAQVLEQKSLGGRLVVLAPDGTLVGALTFHDLLAAGVV